MNLYSSERYPTLSFALGHRRTTLLPRESPTMLPTFPSVRSALVVCALVAPMCLHGQSRYGGDGFLYGHPHVSLTLRGGLVQPTARSDIFAFSKKNLTLGQKDYLSGNVGVDVGVRLANRLDLQVGVAYSSRSAKSEFRDWVDNESKPIEQTTTFRRTPITVGLKYYLTEPGRTLGRLAWVPNKVTPYVAAGGGLVSYLYRQSGDFVDFKTLDVFNSTLTSQATTLTGFAAAGVGYSLSSSFGLTTEARFDSARGQTTKDFQGFSRIDLSGVAMTVGLTVRF